jgi:tRNA nucleotidyltransferase (CCA-adding enzyme)
MHLILTHEQADFDALASLVGARLLQPRALAVLPRRLNRNVRAYLTLYGDKLPLVEFGDLPRGKLKSITLVDTQALPALKGFTADTQVRILDHHPKTSELDPSWTVQLEEVGATTTLLVEAIQEAGIELDLVAATLLLLGIHEDTGSLTYTSTTPRDVRACASLLELGASLSVAGDFLDHPLSNGQRRVFAGLLESAETHALHGLHVVIATADGGDLIDEVSTLAHKLVDVFDPDGLFVLVALDDCVQMVARSTSEGLDVGMIAEKFGGGGHARAAAASIQGQSVQHIRDTLLRLLAEMIKPPLTVGEIMSREPQLLSPSTTIADAAERMKRFGHEGYPVVEGGRVVGLLTRRAVDRAMSHGMEDRPLSSVMTAGEVIVRPSDSIQHLQQVMIEHGWGQVPVAEAEDGAIVGIVTRTDLLETLSPNDSHTRSPDLIHELESALPHERLQLLKLVAREAEAQAHALYIVGGFVRDLLLGEPSVDFDLVVEGEAIALAKELSHRYGGHVSSHGRFGTAKWRLTRDDPRLQKALQIEAGADLPGTLDFVTARTEFYTHPSALPSVRSGSIKLDLHRRDFTINTLALRLDGRHYGQLIDHWGGGADLQHRLIRVLHSLSFIDDPTRALRAVRLEQRLGFSIEPRTLELLQQALPLLERVSGERIRNELALIFSEGKLLEIMRRLDDLGLLTAIHADLVWDAWLAARFEEAQRFSPPQVWQLASRPSLETLLFVLWMFRLQVPALRSVCGRLKLSMEMQQIIEQASRIGTEFGVLAAETKASQVVSRLEGMHEQALVGAWLAASEEPGVRHALSTYLTEWRHVSPQADGNSLRALGLPQGPVYKQILWRLRAAWLDGEIGSAKEEERLMQCLVGKAQQDEE